MNECTKGDPLRAQPHATARRSCVTLGLKICGYLAGQHFNETGPVHADRLPFVECAREQQSPFRLSRRSEPSPRPHTAMTKQNTRQLAGVSKLSSQIVP